MDRFGIDYLDTQRQLFGGDLYAALAAYNGGPHNVEQWLKAKGPGIELDAFVEEIPFRETRNYVMRVTESLPIYRARLGRDPHPVPFSEELKGRA